MSRHRTSNAQGIFLMLGANVAFAAMAAADKELTDLSASEVVFIRSALGTAAFLLYFLWKKNSGWPGKNPPVLTARGTFGFIALFLYFWALPKLHLGTAVMLNYTAPIFAVILSHWVLKEKSAHHAKALIAASFFGVYLLTAPQITEQPVAFAAALASGFFVGVVHILIRRSTAGQEPPLLIIFYFMAICMIGALFLWPFSQWRMPAPREWIFLWVITVTSILGQLGLTYSLRKAAVTVVSPFGYFTPVMGLLLGFLIWKENPGWDGYLGSVIVIICGALLYRKQTVPTG